MMIAINDQQRKAVRNKIPRLLILYLLKKFADIVFLLKNIVFMFTIIAFAEKNF